MKSDERLLDDLRKMPANPVQTSGQNGAAADANYNSEASPVIVSSPSLDEIFFEMNTKSAALESESAVTEINSTMDGRLDALSLALPDFPELSNIEAPITEPIAATPTALVETAPEIQPEETPPAPSGSTAIVEVTESSVAASAYAQTELVNLPETMSESSAAKSGEPWLPSSEANAEIEAGVPAVVPALAENEAALFMQNEAQASPLEEREALAKNGSGWTAFRERAAGWIRRAFAKLMTIVGMRSA
jgi:hypothetical protein